MGRNDGEEKALGSLGVAYSRLREFGRSIEYFKLQLHIARKLGNRISEGNAVGNIGTVCYLMGQTSFSIKWLEQWISIARECGDLFGEADALWNMSVALNELGQKRKASECAAYAYTIYNTMESPRAVKVLKKLREWSLEAKTAEPFPK